MLSEKKMLLRVAELLAISGGVGAIWSAAQSYFRPTHEFPLFYVVFAGMVVLSLTFLPACMLAGEYVRTVRRPNTWRGKTEDLNPAEIQAMVRWSPKTYLVGACVGILVPIGDALRSVSTTVPDSHSVNFEDITGTALYFCMFFLLALPILGSAARMPGSCAANDA
jgi:hypothetical protein